MTRTALVLLSMLVCANTAAEPMQFDRTASALQRCSRTRASRAEPGRYASCGLNSSRRLWAGRKG